MADAKLDVRPIITTPTIKVEGTVVTMTFDLSAAKGEVSSTGKTIVFAKGTDKGGTLPIPNTRFSIAGFTVWRKPETPAEHKACAEKQAEVRAAKSA